VQYSGHGTDDIFSLDHSRASTLVENTFLLVLESTIPIALAAVFYFKNEFRLNLDVRFPALLIMFFVFWLMLPLNESAMVFAAAITYVVWRGVRVSTLNDRGLLIFTPVLLHFLLLNTYASLGNRHMLAVSVLVFIFAGEYVSRQRRWLVLVLLLVSYQAIIWVNYTYNHIESPEVDALGWIQEKNISDSIVTDPYGLRLIRDKQVHHLTEYNLVESPLNKSAVENSNWIFLHPSYYRRCFNTGILFREGKFGSHSHPSTCNFINKLVLGGTEFELVKKSSNKLFTPELIFREKLFGEYVILIYEKKDT